MLHELDETHVFMQLMVSIHRETQLMQDPDPSTPAYYLAHRVATYGLLGAAFVIFSQLLAIEKFDHMLWICTYALAVGIPCLSVDAFKLAILKPHEHSGEGSNRIHVSATVGYVACGVAVCSGLWHLDSSAGQVLIITVIL